MPVFRTNGHTCVGPQKTVMALGPALPKSVPDCNYVIVQLLTSYK